MPMIMLMTTYHLVTPQKRALHRLMLNLLDGANDGLYIATITCVWFCDLDKCFDTADHEI